MGTLITIAIIGLIGTVTGFWSSFLKFMKKTLLKAAELLKQAWQVTVNFVSKILVGAKAFVQRIGNKIHEIVKSYSYEKDRKIWTVTKETYEVPPEDVEREIPADIRAMVQNNQNEHDITQELINKLQESA